MCDKSNKEDDKQVVSEPEHFKVRSPVKWTAHEQQWHLKVVSGKSKWMHLPYKCHQHDYLLVWCTLMSWLQDCDKVFSDLLQNYVI